VTGSLAVFEQLSAKRIESKSRNDGCFCRSFIQFGFLKEAFNSRGASAPSEKWFLPKVGTSYSITYVAMIDFNQLAIHIQMAKNWNLI